MVHLWVDANAYPVKDEVPIWMARRQKVPFSAAWPELKYFE